MPRKARVYFPNRRLSAILPSASAFDPWLSLLVALIPLLISLPLLGDDLMAGEHVEFLLGAKTLGLVHFPGYPLYLLASRLMLWVVPHAEEIWRMNFGSLLYACLAGLMIFLTGRRLRFPSLVSALTGITFFFSPFIWQAAVQTHHYAFHILLVTLMVYTTLGLLSANPWHHPRLRFFGWALFCGAAGGQHILLLPWSISALILGVGMGLPHRRAQAADYGLVFSAWVIGALLPYLLLLWCMASPRAFVNTDFAFTYAALRDGFSFSRLASWMAGYACQGYTLGLHAQGLEKALPLTGQVALSFLRQYPFLSLGVMLGGLLLSLKKAFFRPSPPRSWDETNRRLRLASAFMPLFALAGMFIGIIPSAAVIHITLSLGGAYWLLQGLTYCYVRLGNPEPPAVLFAPRPRPSWFGVTVVLLVPLFSAMQTYSSLTHASMKSSAAPSFLSQTRSFLKALPPRAVLTFPRAELSFPLAYVQRRENLRRDVVLAPFSRLWPHRPFIGLPVFDCRHPLGSASPSRLAFGRYWIQGLSEIVLGGDPVFFLSLPMRIQPQLSYLTQSFDLSPAAESLPEVWCPNQIRYLSVYSVQPLPLPALPGETVPPAPRAGTFQSGIHVLADAAPHPIKYPQRFSLLKFTLRWQVAHSLPWKHLLVTFWIVPAGNPQPLVMPEGIQQHWKVSRRFPQGMSLTRRVPHQPWMETYQLAVPASLPLGRYMIYAALRDPATQTFLAPESPRRFSTHYLLVSEFWVVTSELPMPGSIVPNSVP